jgi:hypothetical protein
MGQGIATDAERIADLENPIARQLDWLWAWLRPRLVQQVLALRIGTLTPALLLTWESELFQLLREFGRRLLETAIGELENESSPGELAFYEGAVYRRTNRRTRHAFVATLLGTVSLWRYVHRPREAGHELCLFPLELRLGLLWGATPALTNLIGLRMAEAGAIQSRVLKYLEQQHDVKFGVKRLRRLVESLSAGRA